MPTELQAYFGEIKAVMIGSLLSVLATGTLFIFSTFQNIPSMLIITPLMSLFCSYLRHSFCNRFLSLSLLFPDKNGPASSLVMSMRTFICALTVQSAPLPL